MKMDLKELREELIKYEEWWVETVDEMMIPKLSIEEIVDKYLETRK